MSFCQSQLDALTLNLGNTSVSVLSIVLSNVEVPYSPEPKWSKQKSFVQLKLLLNIKKKGQTWDIK